MATMAMHRRGNVKHCSELPTMASEVSHRVRREDWPGVTASWARVSMVARDHKDGL